MQVNTKPGSEDFKITSNWEDSSKQLKTKFSTLTDEDIKFETGKEDELLGRIGKRLGKNKEEVVLLIKGIQSKN